MRKTLATLATLAALAIGALGGALAGTALASEPSYDPFRQDTFPCMEDEVLAFDPSFGPDRVGCVHFEDITN